MSEPQVGKPRIVIVGGGAGDDHNHLITPEERLQVAMAKQ